MTGLVIVNPSSGPDAGAVEVVAEHFVGHEVVEAGSDAIAALARLGVESGATFVAMAGGDGSIRCAASVLAGTGVPLVPVPTGTGNHFARELGIDTVAAAAAALAGRRRLVDLAEVNGHHFVNNSSIGFYAALVRERDHHERRLPSWLANVSAAWAQARRGHRFRVTVGQSRYRAWLVFVGNGCYGEGLTDLMNRQALDQAVLDVRVLRADAALARTRTVLALLVGRLGRSSLLVQEQEAEVEIAMQSTVEVALDGEVVRLSSPLRYRSLPGALTVLVPSEADAKVGA